PAFDIAEITTTLVHDLPNLDAAAAARVQEHFRRLGREGEAWVAGGMGRIVPAENGNDSCPFCAQDLSLSVVVGHYRAYFGEEYTRLKRSISQALIQFNELHSRE